MTVSGVARHNAIYFDANGYTITGGTLITGSPNPGAFWVTAPGVTATVNSAVSGTNLRLWKTGTGTVNITSGSFNPRGMVVNGGTVNYTGTGAFTLGNPGLWVGTSTSSVWNHSAGSLTVNSWLSIADGVGSQGTYNLSGTGQLTSNVQQIDVGARDDGWFNMSGDTSVTAPMIALGDHGAGGLGTVQQDGGTVTVGSVVIGRTGDGTYNLEGGTLRTNSIDETGNGDFNWGGGTLTTREVGSNSTADLGDVSSAGFNEVKLGTSIAVNGGIATGLNGGASTLDLNSLYINNGVRFDQLAVTGDLNLAAAGDTLDLSINPYLLRPNIGTAIESGEIPLVTVTGTLTDEFDTGPTFLQDNIGWSEYTGAWTVGISNAATTLSKNEYFLEYDINGGITLHYKVEGTVPEPGTLGMLLAGVILIRGMRQR